MTQGKKDQNRHDEIRRLAAQSKYTYAQIARIVGVSRRTVQNVLTEKRNARTRDPMKNLGLDYAQLRRKKNVHL